MIDVPPANGDYGKRARAPKRRSALKDGSQMTFTDAAAEVLRLVGRPLHYKEITDIAIEKNLLSHVGKSPEVTMGARLAATLKKDSPENPLVRVRPGVFALREWDDRTIRAGLEAKKGRKPTRAEPPTPVRAETKDEDDEVLIGTEEPPMMDDVEPEPESEEATEAVAEREEEFADVAARQEEGEGSEEAADDVAEAKGAAPSSPSRPEDEGSPGSMPDGERGPGGGRPGGGRGPGGGRPEGGHGPGGGRPEGGRGPGGARWSPSAVAAAVTGLDEAPGPGLEEEEAEEDPGEPPGPDDVMRAEAAAGAAEMFDEEDDDDQPILGSSDDRTGPSGAEQGEGRRRRRRRRRGRTNGEPPAPSAGGLPSYTATPAFENRRERERDFDRRESGPTRELAFPERRSDGGQSEAPYRPQVIELTGSDGHALDDLAGRDLSDMIAVILATFDRSAGAVSLRSIAETAQRRGRLAGDPQLVQSQISAAMRADNARRIAAGQRPRFRLAGGRVALTDWLLSNDLARLEQDALAAVERYRDAARRAFARKLSELPGHAFVEVCVLALEKIGFCQLRALRRPGVPGGESHFTGVLRVAAMDELRVGLVIRRDGREVGRERVADLRGSLHHYGPAHAGWIFTAGQMLSGAREEAAVSGTAPIALFDGLAVARLCEDNDVAVIRARLPIAIPDIDLLEALRAS